MWFKAVIPSAAALVICVSATAWATRDDASDYPSIAYDHPAINYVKRAPKDPVARLRERLERGEVRLEFDSKQGYLPSVLKQLDINADSQMLVFSKTSVQGPKISPEFPRALYFNDDVAVGYVPKGPVLEFAALDPNQGIVFYTLERQKAQRPSFVHWREECLSCHLIANTLNIPGLLATSVIPRPDGSPRLTAAAVVVDSRTSIDQRWGGWYVTGKSGEVQHRGNAFAPNPDQPTVLDLRNAQNITSLAGRLDTSTYLLPTSDIVALMVLEHQNRMTSFFTRVNWEARIAEQEGKMAEFRQRLEFLTDEMVSYMLFADEAKMRDPISGVSTFTKTFPARGPRDKKGRSLRDFDLQTRVFRYPLSYMIYNPAFDALPSIAKDQVYRKLFIALTSRDLRNESQKDAAQNDASQKKESRISVEDRQAILEIVLDTKPGIPAYWKTQTDNRDSRNIP
jgi:hypothetical protein